MSDAAVEQEAEHPAELVRAELERRAARLARVPEQAATSDLTDLVVFRAGGESYGIAASSVSAVFRLAGMTVVPGASAYVCGLTVFKGHVLPVLDLRVLLGAPAGPAGENATVVAIGDDRAQLGLLADSIDGMRATPASAILEPPGQAEDDGSSFVSGMTTDAVLVIDADALVRLFRGGRT